MLHRIDWLNRAGTIGVTWNPVTGCSLLSEGCRNCYAARMAKRLQAMGSPRYRNGFQVTLHPELLEQPLHWKKPRRVFVCSMSDLFHEDVGDGFLDQVFGIMSVSYSWDLGHRFLLLTKRPDRAATYLQTREPLRIIDAGRKLLRGCGPQRMSDAAVTRWPLPNLALGVSVESSACCHRIDALREIPAHRRFVSFEPLLEEITFLKPEASSLPLAGIDWAIVGGESGPGFREMPLRGLKGLVEECDRQHVPVFVKQDSGPRPGRQGRIPDELWRRKEFPGAD